MKHARVAYAGAIHTARPWEPNGQADRLRLSDGRVIAHSQVVWLPPFEVGTIIALGLNYADHAKELEFTGQEEPLVFLKGPNTLLGHLGYTRRPADVRFMHYECELAVVMGRPAERVRRAHAASYIAGYCVANDYTIRDYLENWYRPNLRAKNRDGATVLGPWLVDACDIPNPGNLNVRTLVNGEITQRGNTRDMITDVGSLIEYITSFMTLSPGDVILTGTPEGVVNVNVGDTITCEIDGLGSLQNTIADDRLFGR